MRVRYVGKSKFGGSITSGRNAVLTGYDFTLDRATHAIGMAAIQFVLFIAMFGHGIRNRSVSVIFTGGLIGCFGGGTKICNSMTDVWP